MDQEPVQSVPPPAGSGLVRTFFVFMDLPAHVEYRVPDMPVMPEGITIDVEMDVRYPRDPRKVREIDGPYVVRRRRLIYTTKRREAMGLSQYLELEPFQTSRASRG